jgi:hypothetical protein
MILKNLFRANDWKLSEFLALVGSVQFALLGLALLGALGYEVPLARPVIGFVYLTFVPGMLLLRIFRVHGLSGAESTLYAAGMSLLFDMRALRALGAAREAAVFATAPFVGAALAMPLLGERPTARTLGAGLAMGVGVGLLVLARHRHLHRHQELDHDHLHVHDDHHRHAHEGPAVEPHAHPHRHAALVHDHPHVSDVHHRHAHDPAST